MGIHCRQLILRGPPDSLAVSEGSSSNVREQGIGGEREEGRGEGKRDSMGTFGDSRSGSRGGEGRKKDKEGSLCWGVHALFPH